LFIEAIDVADIEFVTQTTYDEKAVVSKIMATGEQKLLQGIAIQLAIVGWGNKTYGSVKIEGSEYDIKSVFDRFGFKHTLSESEKLEEDDVTPSRLVRVFRFHIKKFMSSANKTSYLYNKYLIDKSQPGNKFEIFPFSESLVKTSNEIKMLRAAYTEMDRRLGTGFLSRCDRVLVARGVRF
jgi:hypothetical protein